MKSSEGEIVPLVDVIKTALARGQVEKWLLELEVDMKKSVRKIVADSVDDYPVRARHEWVLLWPGQIVCGVRGNASLGCQRFCFQVQSIAMMFWTIEVHESITVSLAAMEVYLGKCNAQISNVIDLVRGKLNSQNRITLGNVNVLNYF